MENMNDRIKAYPKLLDNYIKNNQVLLKQIPDEYNIIPNEGLSDKTIKTMKTFVLHLTKELTFWNYPELSRNPIVSNYKSVYEQALIDTKAAVDLAETNPQQAISKLKNAINSVQASCKIASTTQLARLFKEFKNKNNYFFLGFKAAIKPDHNNSYYTYTQWYEGFHYGMEYKQAIQSIESLVRENGLTYIETTQLLKNEIENLLLKSNDLFHEQEQKVKDLWENNKIELEKQKEDALAFIDEKNRKLSELENTYEEKLRLSKPADYWNKMSKKYRNSGVLWLIVSIVLSMGIIIGLIAFVISTPDLFAEKNHWLDLVKNTALITVITSVAIYALRVTVKLSMSSFHLSRDAKEREQLSYFYLSLMNEEAVSEKERALIINSLFSRSDTGLLKGDSSPTMSNNIIELLEKDKTK